MRGVGCFDDDIHCRGDHRVSVPLRGVGCFYLLIKAVSHGKMFPSPCGVWVVSPKRKTHTSTAVFPSPCGVWVVSAISDARPASIQSFRPLAGCGLFHIIVIQAGRNGCFRPLAGCGLFRLSGGDPSPLWVSVPLRGVGCFAGGGIAIGAKRVSVPLRGVGCFHQIKPVYKIEEVSVPLRGVGCFQEEEMTAWQRRFPSPCGVWVVSAKLHILSGATGKRIVNSAILLYHIGRCLSIAN